MRLNIALVDHSGIELTCDHDLGRGKPGSQITPAKTEYGSQYSFPLSCPLIDSGGAQIRVEDHRSVSAWPQARFGQRAAVRTPR